MVGTVSMFKGSWSVRFVCSKGRGRYGSYVQRVVGFPIVGFLYCLFSIIRPFKLFVLIRRVHLKGRIILNIHGEDGEQDPDEPK